MSFELAGRAQPYDLEKREAPGTTKICTGTLIGPRQILTAAHCVDDLKRGWFKLDAGPAEGIPFFAPVIHPGYAGADKGRRISRSCSCRAVPGIDFPELAGATPAVGEALTLVGCGATGSDAPSDGRKRSAQNSIEAVQPYTFTFAGFRWGDGITYPGDSGGPSFAVRGGKRELVGVHSTSVLNLTTLWIFDTSGAWDTRVDVYTDWISQVAWNPAAAAAARYYACTRPCTRRCPPASTSSSRRPAAMPIRRSASPSTAAHHRLHPVARCGSASVRSPSGRTSSPSARATRMASSPGSSGASRSRRLALAPCRPMATLLR
ncbi:MAG: S1 family peptidase [Proteobacteria bacterium]|nr:S1 family peptidase [Pseudomonadota bacterium]